MTVDEKKRAAQAQAIRNKFQDVMAKHTPGTFKNDPRSEEIYKYVQAADTVLNYFHWTRGKHGASGEILLFELDMLFAAVDSGKPKN